MQHPFSVLIRTWEWSVVFLFTEHYPISGFKFTFWYVEESISYLLLGTLKPNSFFKNLYSVFRIMDFVYFYYLVWSILKFREQKVFCDNSFTFLFGVSSFFMDVLYKDYFLKIGFIYYVRMLSWYCPVRLIFYLFL